MITINANKILVPIDFSETSVMAIQHAVTVAKLFKGEIVLLNVQKKADLLEIILPALKVADTGTIVSFVKHKLEALAEKFRRSGDKISTDVVLGHIPSKITDYALENDIGLIVMGTHGSDSTGDFL